VIGAFDRICHLIGILNMRGFMARRARACPGRIRSRTLSPSYAAGFWTVTRGTPPRPWARHSSWTPWLVCIRARPLSRAAKLGTVKALAATPFPAHSTGLRTGGSSPLYGPAEAVPW